MSKYHMPINHIFRDMPASPPLRSFEEIAEVIASDGLNSIEIIPREVNEWHEPSAFLTGILPPSLYRPVWHSEIPNACYELAKSAAPEEIAKLFIRMRQSYNCRLSATSSPYGKSVTVAELTHALAMTEIRFPDSSAPGRLMPHLRLYFLDEAVSRNNLMPIEYRLPSGQQIDYVIDEIYDHCMVANVNVLGDLSSRGTPLGFSIQRRLEVGGLILPPSFSIESSDDVWDVYLVDDEPSRVESVISSLHDHGNRRGFRVARRFPLPVAGYRFSSRCAERLEFDGGFQIYTGPVSLGDFDGVPPPPEVGTAQVEPY